MGTVDIVITRYNIISGEPKIRERVTPGNEVSFIYELVLNESLNESLISLRPINQRWDLFLEFDNI